MKKGTAAVLVLFFVMTLGFAGGLFRGYDRPDVHEEIVADSVVMLHTMDGDQSSEKVVSAIAIEGASDEEENSADTTEPVAE